MTTITEAAQKSSQVPIIPLDFNANQPKTIKLYPLSNYTFGTKEHQPEEDPSVTARLKRLEEHYSEHGMRRTCEGILMCHEYNHPHVLMLKIANAFFKLYDAPSYLPRSVVLTHPSPGDYLLPTDDEITGFKARLDERLAPPAGTSLAAENSTPDWDIGDCLSQWWRPNFETFMYPFIPGHISRPKECKKLYFVQLPRSKVLCVPKNMRIVAVPLYELYDNTNKYGPQLAAIPHLLSRYNFEFVDEEGRAVAQTPGKGLMVGDETVKIKVMAGGGEDAVKGEDAENGHVREQDIKTEDIKVEG